MNRYRLFVFVAATLSAVLWAYACGEGTAEPPTPPPDPPRPTTVTVSPATAEVAALGETVQLSAEVRDQNGQAMAGATVTWSSSAVSVAVLPAEATIAALGDTLRLAAEAFDANGRAVAGAEFSWASSDNAVATVNGSGLVTVAGNGKATITATVGSVSGTSEITVIEPPRPTTVTLSPETAELTSPGVTVQLAAEVRDQNGQVVTGVSVTWASSDERTARVDAEGLVTAVAGGATTITAMAGEASGTTEIMVIDMEWAADFVARQHVVDVMNVGVRVDPDCTADCERTLYPGDGRRDLGGIKEVTGIDMSMTSPGQGNYPEQFSDGRVANVRVVRTYADIEVAREDGDFAIMWYLQTRPATGRWQLGGDVATLRDWYDEGLRVLQIAYGSRREDAKRAG